MAVVGGLGVEKRQGRYGRAQQVHGVGVRWGGAQQVNDRAGQVALGAQLLVECRQFGNGRQLAVEQQVGDLFVGGVFGQFD